MLVCCFSLDVIVALPFVLRTEYFIEHNSTMASHSTKAIMVKRSICFTSHTMLHRYVPYTLFQLLFSNFETGRSSFRVMGPAFFALWSDEGRIASRFSVTISGGSSYYQIFGTLVPTPTPEDNHIPPQQFAHMPKELFRSGVADKKIGETSALPEVIS